MLDQLRDRAVAAVFGGGLAAEIARRGGGWLTGEVRQTFDREPERLTRVQLRPGETYTVIARPRASKVERRLARKAEGLRNADEKLSRPSRRQLSAARRLERTQRRLDRRAPDSRRYRRLAAKEQRRGERFDAVTVPSKKLARVRAQRARTDLALDEVRAANFAAARRSGRHRPRRKVRVYD